MTVEHIFWLTPQWASSMREIYYFLNLTNILIHPHFGYFSNSTGKMV